MQLTEVIGLPDGSIITDFTVPIKKDFGTSMGKILRRGVIVGDANISFKATIFKPEGALAQAQPGALEGQLITFGVSATSGKDTTKVQYYTKAPGEQPVFQITAWGSAATMGGPQAATIPQQHSPPTHAEGPPQWTPSPAPAPQAAPAPAAPRPQSTGLPFEEISLAADNLAGDGHDPTVICTILIAITNGKVALPVPAAPKVLNPELDKYTDEEVPF